jgi:hypothetical protein
MAGVAAVLAVVEAAEALVDSVEALRAAAGLAAVGDGWLSPLRH